MPTTAGMRLNPAVVRSIPHPRDWRVPCALQRSTDAALRGTDRAEPVGLLRLASGVEIAVTMSSAGCASVACGACVAHMLRVLHAWCMPLCRTSPCALRT
jgi:hypothetical protein